MNEIEELRNFRTTVDEPAAGAMNRMRAKAIEGASSLRRGSGSGLASAPAFGAAGSVRVWRGRLALAGAAVAVAVAILTVSVVTRPGSVPSGPAPVASAPVTTEPPRPPTAVERIEALAQLAAAGPAAPVPTNGQVIRATDRYQQDGAWHTDTYHVDPQGLIVLDNSEFGGRGSFKQFVEQQRAMFAHGPSIRQPTPAFLATLDVSPAHLRQLYAADLVCPPGGCQPRDADWQLWNNIKLTVMRGDVIFPPAFRAGLLRLIATIPDLTAESFTFEGHDYLAVGLASAGTRHEYLIDPATGRIAGSAAMTLTHVVDEAGCSSALAQSLSTPQPTTTGRPAACAQVPIPTADLTRDGTVSLWETALVAG